MNPNTSFEHKIMSWKQAEKQVALWKSKQQKVVFTNGVFDLIHKGHITYLRDAAALGHRLIIALNADSSVRRLAKGPARPIKDEDSRAFILSALQFVDGVVIFDQDTPFKIIQLLAPDILVKGGDYDPLETNEASKKYIVGRDVVMQQGGEVQVISFLPGYSTTTIEQKIIRAHHP